MVPEHWFLGLAQEPVQRTLKVTLCSLCLNWAGTCRYLIMRSWLNDRMSRWVQLWLLFPSHVEFFFFCMSHTVLCYSGNSQFQVSKLYTACFYLTSCIQFQFLQTSCGVQSPARRLQAPAESTDRWEPNLAWRAWTEDSGRQNSEAAAAARHGGPAGTQHLHYRNMSDSTPGSWIDVVWYPLRFLFPHI